MNRIALLLVLALVATGASGSVADARPKRKPAVLKIKKAPAIPDGLTIDVQEDMSMDLVANVGSTGRAMPVKMTGVKRYRVDVVDGDGDAVRRATVVYGTVTKTQSMGGAPKGGGDPRDGQTYHLEAGASGVKITDSAGIEVTEPELLKDLRRDHVDMMRGSAMRGFLIGRSFKTGKKVKLGDEEFEAIFPSETNVDVSTFTVTLESVKGRLATFSFAATFTLTEGAIPLTIDATGTFEVDTNLVLLASVTFDGTIAATMKQDKETITMAGTMKVVSRTTYTVP